MSWGARRVTLPAITPLVLQKRVIKVYSEDGASRALEVPNDIVARDVCQLIILRNHYIDDNSWTLCEHLPHLGLERTIEDHETVIDLQSNWGAEEGRFYFRKNYAKYDFFKNPGNYFPSHMVSFSNEVHEPLTEEGKLKLYSKAQHEGAAKVKENLMQLFFDRVITEEVEMLLSSSTYPEVHGHLHVKDNGKKSWRKLYFLLRRSGLYFSTKGTSREPRYLQFFSEFNKSDVYLLLSAKQANGAPTPYAFCFKLHNTGGARDLKLLCAEDQETRTCWVTAIRVFKHGMQLYQNYMKPLNSKSYPNEQNMSPARSISENSLVAMDFSGNSTRVIENPTEARSVAVQEGLLWRRKSCTRLNAHGLPSTTECSTSNIAIHISQPWFHHKISRDEAQRLITQQGLVDGVFLMRDSRSNPKHFVLSLCHGQKIKHFQVVMLEDDGERLYTLDDGHTRFIDLIQLVDFYQLNRGVLPCKLKHYCARVTI